MTKVFPPDHDDILRHFAVTAPHFAAASGIADVWRVVQSDGRAAALKIYHNRNMQDEAPGFDLLRALDGHGAVRVLAQKEGAVLLEWLEGPPLSALTLAGQDDAACAILLETVRRMHAIPVAPIASLPTLEKRFRALISATFTADCPGRVADSLRFACATAERLLPSQSEPRPLHGDLHHDNIKDSARGYLAFDAKGVFGDPLYEVANAFQNPLGADDFVLDTQTITKRAAIWAEGLRTTAPHLLDWAIAHAGLSLAWHTDGVIGPALRPHIGKLESLITVRATYDQGA